MLDPSPRLQRLLQDETHAWLVEARSRVAGNRRELLRLFPQLPRRIGREGIAGGKSEAGDQHVDFDAWRRCDAAALLLLQAAGRDDDLRIDLYLHGDLEERTMVLRALAAEPISGATVRLLEEVQRTNMVTHFEAGVCDSNLAVRASADERFGIEGFNRLILKLAFLDLPAARVLDCERCANEELSRMLQGLATEREAAGRSVWPDTDRLSARAPTRGTLARLIGHLEHGDDRLRLAAAEGLALHAGGNVRAFLEERLPREPRPEIRAAIQRALAR